MISKARGSFRDPCGQVYIHEGKIIRSVNLSYQEDWELALSSGLLQTLLDKEYIIPFKESESTFNHAHINQPWKALEVEKIPFISYPYEWSFPQLKQAALLTLKIQKIAVEHGMTLKDASAYNIQFHKGKPIFIDLLSFEKISIGEPWQAYRQFCMHFLAPLALQSYDYRLTRLSAVWIDGIPLDVAWRMLPPRAAFFGGLQLHLHMHALAEKKYEDGNVAVKNQHKKKLSRKQLMELIDSLTRTIHALPTPKEIGEWAKYYENTNYTSVSQGQKEDFVAQKAKEFSSKLAIDLGANTGKYSLILSPHFETVIAADIDSTAVANHYNNLKANNILPLVQDLANPSMGIGWACQERMSIMQRGEADMICALALTHHLFFSAGIPWYEQAEFFAALLKSGAALVIEYVAREDSQVQLMLSTRDDIFTNFSLEDFKSNFEIFFEAKEEHHIKDSHRTLLVYTKK